MINTVVKSNVIQFPDSIVRDGEFMNQLSYVEINSGARIYYSPTNNCQIYSIAGIQDLFDEHEGSNGEALKILKEIQTIVQKNVLMVDIEEEYIDILDSIFDERDFILKAVYENTTTNSMVMCLINTDKLKVK